MDTLNDLIIQQIDEILAGLADESIGRKDVEEALKKLKKYLQGDASQVEAEAALAGIFREAMQALNNPTAAEMGKRGGASRSEAKRASSAENGKLGGRPARRAYCVAWDDQQWKWCAGTPGEMTLREAREEARRRNEAG